MKVVVITDEKLKSELVVGRWSSDVIFTNSLENAIKFKDAGAIIDLLFVSEEDRITKLASCLPALIVINCVEHTSNEIHPSFVRINAWPTLINSAVIEAYGPASQQFIVEKIFQLFNKGIVWTKDLPGFISARIIACIIREAKLAFEEGISSKEEIDRAMQLGTSYPYGPFEWYEKIGQERVDALLSRLK